MMTERQYYSDKTRTSSSSSTSSSTSRSTSISGSSSTTTTAINTHPGVSYFDEVFERLGPIYENCVLSPMTATVMWKVKEYMEDYGLTYEVIEAAIYDTGLAPRPSARYLLAILDRCAMDEICTLEDWKEEKRKHERKSYFRMRRNYNDGPNF